MSSLTWRDRPSRFGHGTIYHDGKLGSVTLFTYGHGSGGDKPWRLDCHLPGYESKYWTHESEDAVKSLTERVLARWLEITGLQVVTAVTS